MGRLSVYKKKRCEEDNGNFKNRKGKHVHLIGLLNKPPVCLTLSARAICLTHPLTTLVSNLLKWVHLRCQQQNLSSR